MAAEKKAKAQETLETMRMEQEALINTIGMTN
jgi:hypothetical protein